MFISFISHSYPFYLQHAMSTALVRTREVSAKGSKTEDEKGVRLAPSSKDLKPWYVSEDVQNEEMPEDKRYVQQLYSNAGRLTTL